MKTDQFDFSNQFYFELIQYFKKVNFVYLQTEEYSDLDSSIKLNIDKIIGLQLSLLSKLELKKGVVKDFLSNTLAIKEIFENEDANELAECMLQILNQYKIAKVTSTLEKFINTARSQDFNPNNFNQGVPDQLIELSKQLEGVTDFDRQLSIIDSFSRKDENFLARNYLDINSEKTITPFDQFIKTAAQTVISLIKILIPPNPANSDSADNLMSTWVGEDQKIVGELYLPLLNKFYESFKDTDRAEVNIISIGCSGVGTQQVYPWVYKYSTKKIVIDLFDSYLDVLNPDFIDESNKDKWSYDKSNTSYKYNLSNLTVNIYPSFPIKWGSEAASEIFKPFLESLVMGHLEKGNNVIISQHTGGSVVDDILVSIYDTIGAKNQSYLSKLTIFGQNKCWPTIEYCPDNPLSSEGVVLHHDDAPLLIGITNLDEAAT